MPLITQNNQELPNDIIPSKMEVTPQESARYKKFHEEHIRYILYSQYSSVTREYPEIESQNKNNFYKKSYEKNDERTIFLEKECGDRNDETKFYQAYYDKHITNYFKKRSERHNNITFTSQDILLSKIIINNQVIESLNKHILASTSNINLSFQNCFFTSSTISQIAQICKNNTICKLSFSSLSTSVYRHYVKQNEVNYLFNNLIGHETLTSLELLGEDFVDESFKNIAILIAQNDELRRLTLHSSNSILKDQDIALLFECLKQRQFPLYVKLKISNISKNTAHSLLKIMQDNENIFIKCECVTYEYKQSMLTGLDERCYDQEAIKINSEIQQLLSSRLKTMEENAEKLVQQQETENQTEEEEYLADLAGRKDEESKNQEKRDEETNKALALHRYDNIKPLFIKSGVLTIATAGLLAIYKSYTAKLDNKLANRINLGVAIASLTLGGGLFAIALYRCATSRLYTNKVDDEKKINPEISPDVQTTI